MHPTVHERDTNARRLCRYVSQLSLGVQWINKGPPNFLPRSFSGLYGRLTGQCTKPRRCVLCIMKIGLVSTSDLSEACKTDVSVTKHVRHVRQCSFGCRGEPPVFFLLAAAIQASLLVGYSLADKSVKKRSVSFPIKKICAVICSVVRWHYNKNRHERIIDFEFEVISKQIVVLAEYY